MRDRRLLGAGDHQVSPYSRIDQPSYQHASVAPQFRLHSPEPLHLNRAPGQSPAPCQSRRSPEPQDHAINVVLHDATFVSNQLDPVTLGARDHAAAAVQHNGSFVGNDGEQIGKRLHAVQGSATPGSSGKIVGTYSGASQIGGGGRGSQRQDAA